MTYQIETVLMNPYSRYVHRQGSGRQMKCGLAKPSYMKNVLGMQEAYAMSVKAKACKKCFPELYQAQSGGGVNYNNAPTPGGGGGIGPITGGNNGS